MITKGLRRHTGIRSLALLIALGMHGAAQGQSSPPATRALQLPLSGRLAGGVDVHQSAPAPSGSSTNVQVEVEGVYAGSVPSSESVPDALELTLAEAIQRGLRTNLGVISSNISVKQAQAQRAEARSALLPNIHASASENGEKLNLAAQGFSAAAFGITSPIAFPATVGPFHYYDLHGSLQQSLLDVTAIRNSRVQGYAYQAAILESLYAREDVVLAVSGVYLQLVADLALLERQRAEVAYAEATYKQAQAQVDAGNKAQIEANRSLVELQTEQQRLRSQQGEVEKRQVQFARLIGLPPGLHVRPTDHLEGIPADVPSLPEAVQRGWAQRQDLKAVEAQLRSAEEARKAASAQRLPSLSLSGTYGLQGVNLNQGSPVFEASAAVNVPIFQGGRIEADIASADAVLRQRRAELADERGLVEADVRNAYIDLQVGNDQITLADSNRKLAAQTLQQSQDRFAVGVADSVEVVNAQQALATADHDYVYSLFSQHVAMLSLAHAMGETEKDLDTWFERKAQ